MNLTPLDLLIAQKQMYIPLKLTFNNFTKEHESQEYEACTFIINNKRICFRISKITPTKAGQFVTFWKRIKSGPITPYDISDPFDLLIVSARKEEKLGQFVFPKAILHQKGLLSKNETGGKRAMRIYPPWSITKSKQAQKTQAWQLRYFFEIPLQKIVTHTSLKKLFI